MESQPNNWLKAEIIKKKRQENIYIIAHYYQRDDIQDIADFVGDSYAMAVAARNSDHKTILVAGVDFMAESAAILCPGKTILSPETQATCPMAASVSAFDILAYKEEYPDSVVLSYVNTPAEVKAVSDICCTSSNALKILQRIPAGTRIYFIPDKNLALNLAGKYEGSIDMYDSYCPIHARVNKEKILVLKNAYPDAPVLVHPECSPDVIKIADYTGSTAGIVDYVTKSDRTCFIIATECGIIHGIQKASPGKKIVLADDDLLCTNMKSITLEKVLKSIENRETIIKVPESVRLKAAGALEKMIAYTS